MNSDMAPVEPGTVEDEIAKLVRSRIETLRPKLLDLTRHNPLISTRFSERSHSHVRVVDELPGVILDQLGAGSMRFVPLPPLEEDPKDEQELDFQNILSDAQLTDEAYLEALDRIDPEAEDSAEALAKAERALKDRIRERLGMPARQTRSDLSLAKHARNNGIAPSYDLPAPDEVHEDGRHIDTDIQTLLLADVLERRLNALMTKQRTWIQETGIHVLQAAFGFLEWRESDDSKHSLAPLLLLPVTIEKTRTRQGTEFHVRGLDEPPEINTVFSEKLSREFGVELPEFDEGATPEDYFSEVERAAPRRLRWRIRRQVAIGVFPSARMAMYRDLEPHRWEFNEHPVVGQLFGGRTEDSDVSPFGEEYEVDSPDVEKEVPYLIAEADSSQFSVIVDIARDRNLAVEGPPGTGKSQTIVNTIACAIANGKRVLFVAEKMAALEVVKARLEAWGLGEFVLALQASRSTRAQVTKAIRHRVELLKERSPIEYDDLLARFRKVRSDLADYISVLKEPFGKTGWTVHEVLGRSIARRDVLQRLTNSLTKRELPHVDKINAHAVLELRELCTSVETAWKRANDRSGPWRGFAIPNVDPFVADEILEAADTCATVYTDALASREQLARVGIDPTTQTNALRALTQLLSDLAEEMDAAAPELVRKLSSADTLQSVRQFVFQAEEARKLREELEKTLEDPLKDSLCEGLTRLADLSKKHQLADSSDRSFRDTIAEKVAEVEDWRNLVTLLESAEAVSNQLEKLPAKLVFEACLIVSSTSRRALAVRSAQLSDPAAHDFVKKAAAKARDLKQQKLRLSDLFVWNSDTAAKDVARFAAKLASAGLLSILSGEYRIAKRFYRSISKTPKFNRQKAAEQLRELARWLSEEQELLADPRMAALFGIHFEGINTDFEPFVEAIEFFSNVDSRLAGPKAIAVREFLRSAPMDSLTALPEVPTDLKSITQADDTLGDARGELERIEAILNHLEQDEREAAQLSEELGLKRPVTTEMGRVLSDSTEKLRRVYSELENARAVREILGSEFKGPLTDTSPLHTPIKVTEAIVTLDPALAEAVVCALEDKRLDGFRSLLVGVLEAEHAAELSLARVATVARMSPDDLRTDDDLRATAEAMRLAAKDKGGLLAQSRYASLKLQLDETGFGFVVDGLIEAGIQINDLADVVEALIAKAMARDVYALHGTTLGSFSGQALDALRSSLRALDEQIVRLARRRLRCDLIAAAKPPQGNGRGRKSEWTQMQLIEHLVQLKRPNVPVRELTRRAGEALLELKPCWMMSPLAVAQYIPADTVQFDLVVIDEASQMPPEDSIGALVRGRQAMVVGDTNQLPPTTFFHKLFEDEEEDEDTATLEESILELANAVFRPARRLRWHYRSQHSGLIAFSNRHVYDDDLIVFPSPQEDHPQMGVSYVKVDGFYASGTNPKEAQELISAALHFMRSHPDQSLGIVVLNKKQRDLLLQELDFALKKNPRAVEYIETWETKNDGLESFFIKNLENVQGDERDAIFIGTVYGPERTGATVANRFGPINGVAGKRRLNVLFSRAKKRIVTFSSMTSADIRVEEGGNPGAWMLKRWLEYCATGKIEAGEKTHRQPDSDFELYVIEQLRSMGCEPVPQVGVTGYFIDIGVKHPQWPHGFIMGVECDGATYHSSRSARDRDRLRQQVLEERGWNLHRIWSTDWFQDPVRETTRLRKAVEERLKQLTTAAQTQTTASIERDRKVRPERPATPSAKPSTDARPDEENMVKIGDQVLVRYLTEPKREVRVRISDTSHEPKYGIIHKSEPLAQAVLGAESGDEVEVWIGNKPRSAVVEKL